mmetsp:Transcript_8290/g.19499  ORF Transcript_8290/g.19499 Transcript_8290/m.19499 type:complete len:653 (-) Transcript_8290:68-2026(-)
MANQALDTSNASQPGAAVDESSTFHPLPDPEACVPGAEVILAKRLEIRRRERELRRLRKENGLLKAKYDTESGKLDDELKARVADARADDKDEMEELTRRCTALQQAAAAKEAESQRVMGSMEQSHSEAAEQLKGLYELKLTHEEDRCAMLEKDKVKLEEEMNVVLADRAKQLEQEREKFQAELARLTAEKELEIKKHKDLIAFTQHQFEQLMDKTSKDRDVEMTQIKVASVQELDQQKRVEEKLSKEQSTLLYGLDMMEKERERIEKEQHEATWTISNLRSQVEELNRTVKSLETEKRERESTLQDKELKIESYTSKVSTLKKFKHILDKRLNEVTESLQPKDQMIAQLKESLQELEAEFEQVHTDQRAVQDRIDQKQQQILLLKRELQNLKAQMKERDTIILRYSMDLQQVIEIKDQHMWPQEIRRLYHTYVLSSLVGATAPLGADVQHERRLLDRRVTSLVTSGAQMEASSKTDVQRRANENAVLVAELNGLRVHSNSLQREQRRLEKRLEEITQRRWPRTAASSGAPALRGDNYDSAEAVAVPSQRALRPRTPSSGVPGPRQQQSASHGDLAAAARTQTVPPLEKPGQGRAAAARRPLSSGPARRRPDEEKRQLKKLMHSTEVGVQRLQMQKVENKLLQDQVARLVKA